MKKVKKVKQPKGVGGRVIAAFFAVVVFIALMVMWGDADAAEFNYPRQYVAAGYDSVYVQWLRRVTGVNYTATGDTVIQSADLPLTLVIPIADTADWYIREVFYWGTTPSAAPTVDLPYKTASTSGAVELSSEHYDSIETRVVDGSGPNLVTVACLDSSNSDAPVVGATVTFRDPATGTNVRQETADANGLVSFYTSFDTLSYIVTNHLYHTFPGLDTLATGLPATITVYGYELPDPGTPDDPDVCRVWGYVGVLLEGGGVESQANVKVTLTPPENALDTCGVMILVVSPQSDYTDATGRYEIDVTPSTCLGGKPYTLTVSSRGSLNQPRGAKVSGWQVMVPDSATYQVTPAALRAQ